jgi:hypothetical protein
MQWIVESQPMRWRRVSSAITVAAALFGLTGAGLALRVRRPPAQAEHQARPAPAAVTYPDRGPFTLAPADDA